MKKTINTKGLLDFLSENENLKQEEIPITEEQKSFVLNQIKEYSNIGKHLYKEHNLRKTAKILSELATLAHKFVLSENEDWFDKITINRNMKELKNLSGEFSKNANDLQSLQERVCILYEDMGVILNRYFEINDKME